MRKQKAPGIKVNSDSKVIFYRSDNFTIFPAQNHDLAFGHASSYPPIKTRIISTPHTNLTEGFTTVEVSTVNNCRVSCMTNMRSHGGQTYRLSKPLLRWAVLWPVVGLPIPE